MNKATGTKIAAGLTVTVFLVVAMLYMSGAFRKGLIEPANPPASTATPLPAHTARAEIVDIPRTYEAVGTLSAENEAVISSRVNGRILNVAVRTGDPVQKGMGLLSLDDREARARLAQAKQGMIAAEAEHERAKQGEIGARAAEEQARLNYQRIQNYFSQETATRQTLEQAESGWRQARAGSEQAARAVAAAQAGIERAKKVVEEVSIGLDYYTVDAPTTGQVAKRLVDPGDMAWPGKPLLVVQTSDTLRLAAGVPESLINRITPGMALLIDIDALSRQIHGTVQEIEPSADPGSRTFLVKVSLPPSPGVMAGMFGRLHIPVDSRPAVLVPLSVIRRVGQLETVILLDKGQPRRIHVKTGQMVGERIEILAGLAGGEILNATAGPVIP